MDLDARLVLRFETLASAAFQVVSSINDSNDTALKGSAFGLWRRITATQTAKKREYEALQRLEEAALQQQGSLRHASNVMKTLGSWRCTGCCRAVFDAWLLMTQRQQEQHHADRCLEQVQDRLLVARQDSAKKTLATAGNLVRLQEDLHMQRLFAVWRRLYLMARMQRYARDQNTKKRLQLSGVKGLFRNFAQDLGQELSHGTPRTEHDLGSATSVASVVDSHRSF